MNAAARPAVPAPDDHALLYGAGFFETFAVRDGRPVRLPAHLARLRSACARLGVRLPPDSLAASDDPARWGAAVRAALDAAALRDGVCRFTVTAGPCAGPVGAGDYVSPGEWLAARPLPVAPPPEGVTLHRLDTVRDTGAWRPRPKSLNYLNSLLAARELAPRRCHPADEGLMCDALGRVAEGVFMNLFWFDEAGAPETPHEDTGALPGVGRAAVLAGLRAAGGPAREALAGPDSLIRARSVFLVSSVRGVVPVCALRDRAGATLARYAPDAACRLALERALASDS